MQIRTVQVHNFRSLVDVTFCLDDYCLLVGANNAGKTNAIDALRTFYDAHKFDAKTDAPKDGATGDECWIQIEYILTSEEYETLKDEYKIGDNRLRVRKYLKGKSKGIFALKCDEQWATEQFYGAKNVQQGKLGDIIYIPAVSKLDEHMKTSGPSALRDIINKIVGKLVKSSASFQAMVQDFSQKMAEFQEEKTDEDLSLSGLQNDINDRISEWDTEFRLNINPFSETEIVKNLVSFDFHDSQIDDTLPATRYGQGFQRHLIYTLLTLASEYKFERKPSTKKEFRPNLTLILFEEPEAFLHPPQQDVLCRGLQQIGAQEGNQVLISTHSANFVSNNSDNLSAIIRLRRQQGKTAVGQLSEEERKQIFEDNQEINDLLNISDTDENRNLDMEAIKYFLWLNPFRCGMFFANLVLLVEGPTEVAFINYLIANGCVDGPAGGLFVLDCFGKYNIHRFMNLLGCFGINHSVLYDTDKQDDNEKHKRLAELICRSRNEYTYKIETVEPDIERFLGISKASKPHQKPQHLMLQYHQNAIASDKLDKFVALINGLVTGRTCK